MNTGTTIRFFGFFIFASALFFNIDAFAESTSNYCITFERGSKSGISSVDNFFSDKDESHGIGAVKACWPSNDVLFLYHMSDIKYSSGVFFYHRDLVFKGKSSPLLNLNKLPFTGRSDSYPNVFMCMGYKSCDTYDDREFVLVKGMTPYLFRKIKECVLSHADSVEKFRTLFSDAKYFDNSNVARSFVESRSNIDEIRMHITNKESTYIGFSFNPGSIRGVPSYEFDISSDKSWRIVFDLNESCLSAKEVYEVEE